VIDPAVPPIFVKPPDFSREETRVPAGDAQDAEYLLDQIVDLGARVTALEKLFEGRVEHASTEAEANRIERLYPATTKMPVSICLGRPF
jgi:hypothetical protein